MKSLAFLLVLCSVSHAPGQLKEDKKGSWVLSVSFPTFKNRSMTAHYANRYARARERTVFDDFLKQAKKEVPDMKKMGSSAWYELLVEPIAKLDSALVCSGYVRSYAFTGGAHGYTYFESMNLGPMGKRITLQDLFAKGVDGRREASFAVLQQLLRTGQGSSVQEGTWNELTPEQVKNFVMTPRGLVFLFGSYDLGSYAEGTFEIEVPYNDIRGLDLKGPYGNLLGTR